MGNCQAVDAAVLVIQHPDGKLEKMYWSVSASEVMRKNPDHYVTLIMPVPESPDESNSEPQAIKSTHVKLLRSSDSLCLGSSYRLVSSKEVLNVLRAKKSARMSNRQVSPALITENDTGKQDSDLFAGVAEKTTTEDIFKVTGKRSRPPAKKPSMRRSKSWHPSLKTISEISSQ
uniref:Uncharacterized protein n=1 Tax=Kalanchoe fedtschenkoi TaxID=63787 RepID=A0A7N0U232_KALFE